jgi:hypothetical protein
MSAKLLTQTLYVGPTDSQQMISGPLVGIENLAQLTNKLMSFLIPIAAIILIFVLIAGGYDYLTSQGEAGKIKSAHAKFTAGLIGFTILIISYFLVKLIAFIFGLQAGIF